MEIRINRNVFDWEKKERLGWDMKRVDHRLHLLDKRNSIERVRLRRYK